MVEVPHGAYFMILPSAGNEIVIPAYNVPPKPGLYAMFLLSWWGHRSFEVNKMAKFRRSKLQ